MSNPFSRRTRVAVASVVYNLAGDMEQRPQILKGAAILSLMSGKPLVESITKTLIRSHAVKIGAFGRWAENSSELIDVVGSSVGSLASGDNISISELAGEIPTISGGVIQVQTTAIGIADFSYWIDQHIFENYPEEVGTNYVGDYSIITGNITIKLEDTSLVTFTPTGFDRSKRYLYAAYTEVLGEVAGSVITGSTITLDPLDDFPSTIGWSEEDNDVTTHTETLITETTVDVTYSDATPPTHTVTTVSGSDSYDEIHAIYELRTEIPMPPGELGIKVEREIMYQDTTGDITQETTVDVVVEDIGGGVLKTTTTTVVTDVITLTRTYRIDTQEIVYRSWVPTKIFIYEEDSGNATLDAMFNSGEDAGKFFPVIPFRIDNKDFKDEFPEESYEICKKAFKKATGSRYDEVREVILDNEQLNDLDYVYATFGVSLNTKEEAGIQYLYTFFKLLNEDQTRKDEYAYDTWLASWGLSDTSWDEWDAWRTDAYLEGGSLTTEPERLTYPPLPKNYLSVGSDNPTINYNVKLSWNFIEEEFGSGLLEPEAKPGKYWITSESNEKYIERLLSPYYAGGNNVTNSQEHSVPVFHINHQISATEWRRLVVRGLTHENAIYAGKSVLITAHEALIDTKESGFIVPLHRGVFQEMPLAKRSQLVTACVYLVFNVHEEHKDEWYETFGFRFIMVALAIVITIYTFGNDGGTTLGSALSVGEALGFTGQFATIVGTITNYLAAMAIIGTLEHYAIKEFGVEKGTYLTVVASFFIFSSIGKGGIIKDFNIDFTQMLRADKLLMLTSSVGNAYAKLMSIDTAEIMQRTHELQTEYTEKIDEINKKMQELVPNNGTGVIDPIELMDALAIPYESRDAFMQRTLMLGSDIVDMSINMLSNYPAITLNLELS